MGRASRFEHGSLGSSYPSWWGEHGLWQTSYNCLGGECGHTSPYRAKRTLSGMEPADTMDLQAAPLLGLRRGWSVGALAASSSGGTCAADPPAAPSVQVLYALRPVFNDRRPHRKSMSGPASGIRDVPV